MKNTYQINNFSNLFEGLARMLDVAIFNVDGLQPKACHIQNLHFFLSEGLANRLAVTIFILDRCESNTCQNNDFNNLSEGLADSVNAIINLHDLVAKTCQLENFHNFPESLPGSVADVINLHGLGLKTC